MDATGIQSKIYAGYGKTALRVGSMTEVYRPGDPLADPAYVVTLPASFNAEDMRYARPNKYGHPTWYCVADGNYLRVGDYLLSPKDGPFFVAAMQSNLPILVVQSNHVVSITHAHSPTGKGLQPYGGSTIESETPVARGVPASILLGSKGERNDVDLPTDTRTPLWAILIPAPAGVLLRTSDILTDENQRRYVIQSSERTDLGWRLTAIQAQA